MMTSASDLLQGRRSIRQFRPEPVADETVRSLLELACAAPSAHNSRPWRFVVLRDPSMRLQLAQQMAAAWRAEAEVEGITAEEIRARNERSVARITQAPVAILACADHASLPEAASPRFTGEKLLLAQSVAAAVENLLLAANAAGLGACWVCAPAFCPQVVRDALGLNENWEPQALILIGHPAETPDKPAGPTAEEVTLWR